jgi:hypothetical protein
MNIMWVRLSSIPWSEDHALAIVGRLCQTPVQSAVSQRRPTVDPNLWDGCNCRASVPDAGLERRLTETAYKPEQARVRRVHPHAS